MAHVFISYHHNSSRDYARQLADFLIESGFDVWIDDRIDYGTEWERVIFEEGLDRAKAVIVIMTRGAWESKWVRSEREYASHNNIPVFPLRVEDYIFPTYLAMQYVDVRPWQLPRIDFLERLERHIYRKTERGKDVAQVPQQRAAASVGIRSTKRKNSQNWFVFGFVVVIGIVVTALFAPQLRDSLITLLQSRVNPVISTDTPAPTTQHPGASSSDEEPTIVFFTDRSGNNEIYVMHTDGSGLRNLSNDASNDWDPAWSPDGRQIAFRSDRSGNSEIYVMNANGSNLRQLTNNDAADLDPNWSPDGNMIIFRSSRDGNDEIYTMNADGTSPQNLTNNLFNDAQPRWSPNGDLIAFVSYRDGDADIYLMNADGSNWQKLTDETGADFYPVWSPDGSKLLFYSNRDGNYDIYVMNSDGTDPRNIAGNPSFDSLAAWSPDGQQIIFTSNRDGYPELYVMYADGTDVTNLTRSSAYDSGASWRSQE